MNGILYYTGTFYPILPSFPSELLLFNSSIGCGGGTTPSELLSSNSSGGGGGTNPSSDESMVEPMRSRGRPSLSESFSSSSS